MPSLQDQRELDFSASSVTFCELPQEKHVLTAGTYQLDSSTNTRQGRLSFYSIHSRQNEACTLQDLYSLDFPGIFESKWDLYASTLALALADGSLALLKLADPSEPAREALRLKVDDQGLATCVDFTTHSPEHQRRLCVSTSKGMLVEVQVTQSGGRVIREWKAHGLEIWACAFDRWQEHLLFSGADDCALKAWDVRQFGSEPAVVSRQAKEHGAGVCCIQSSSHREHVLCTGSYDEHIRIWDTRMLTCPTMKASTGGGVWRLKWHPSDPTLLLAACMHNGCAVYSTDAASRKLEAAATYHGHSSLAYGADWCWAGQAQSNLVASCSFYDRGFHLWTF